MLIFLVGYMACGKSTIGRKLSRRLNADLYDTDNEVVALEGMSIAELFDTKGEEYFRDRENHVIKSLIDNNVDSVISTGGGAPIWGDNMSIMNNAGLTVYLSRSAENIAKRISMRGREKRPKLRGLDDQQLVEVMQKGIAERDGRYREAKLVLEVDAYSDDMIIDAIVDCIKA
ncbi:MAG: shikimate kinase [Rikenellaceae bacterium]